MFFFPPFIHKERSVSLLTLWGLVFCQELGKRVVGGAGGLKNLGNSDDETQYEEMKSAYMFRDVIQNILSSLKQNNLVEGMKLMPQNVIKDEPLGSTGAVTRIRSMMGTMNVVL